MCEDCGLFLRCTLSDANLEDTMMILSEQNEKLVSQEMLWRTGEGMVNLVSIKMLKTRNVMGER